MYFFSDVIIFASSSTGRILATNRRGSLLWDQEIGSPLVSSYLMDAEGLLVVPFTSMANHTLAHLAVDLIEDQSVVNEQTNRMKL